MLYAADLIYAVSLLLSKVSMVALEQRLSPERMHKLVVQGTLCLSAVAVVAAFLMIALGCDVARPWFQITRECDSLVRVNFGS